VESHFFNTGVGGDQAAFWGSTIYDAFQARTGATGQHSYNIVQEGIVSVLNGGSYSSGTSNSAATGTFSFDHVYSGAATIYGHGGNSVFIDSTYTTGESYYGGTGSNVFYVTESEFSGVNLFSGSSSLDVLRVPGWGSTSTSGNAFGVTDPFVSSGKFNSINMIDVRSGTDSVSPPTSSITLGSGSTTNTTGATFYLSATDIQNITTDSTSPNLVLKLDSCETVVPTGTVDSVVSGNTTYYYNSATHNSTTLVATGTHSDANYYSDVIVFNASNDAHLNIHYGSG